MPTVINSWGWRGPEPTIARDKSVRRAVLLGDSVAFSCWGCRAEVSLGGTLKRALELRTGEEWEVIDAYCDRRASPVFRWAPWRMTPSPSSPTW